MVEKEVQFNLKTVRLRNLEAAESAIGNKDYVEAMSRLKMFANSIKPGSEASQEFKILESKEEARYKKDYASMIYTIEHNDAMLHDLLNGVDDETFREEEMEKIKYQNLLNRHLICWDVSLRFGLIPED